MATGLPVVGLAIILLWLGDFTTKARWTLVLFAGGTWFAGVLAVRERVIRPLQTIANLLAALGEEDYSIRAREARPEDPLGLAYWEVNALTEMLQVRRLQSVEATALLGRVIAEIDAALFAFDAHGALQLINRAGEHLLGHDRGALVGRTAEDLGLADCLAGPAPRVEEAIAGRAGRWEIRRSTFRQDGRPHDLLVINDLSAVLREEERQAWRRLVRVLSHEINNSLAPIKSIADSLAESLVQGGGSEEDFRKGLGVIASRSEALRRFMASYARLARLPAPNRRPVRLAPLVRRVASLETRRTVAIESGPDLVLDADPDQLEQLLINLLSNAVDAVDGTEGAVRVRWAAGTQHVSLHVEDEGPGLPDPSNLFVPFFTTKATGSGIGLVLCRQIAEAHGGWLMVRNRADRSGVTATVRLPLA